MTVIRTWWDALSTLERDDAVLIVAVLSVLVAAQFAPGAA